MGKKSIAAETCRRLAVQTQGLLEAADLLESAEVSESYLAGLKTETESAKSALEKAKQELTAMKEELKKVHAAGVQEIRDTDLKVTALLAEGHAEVDRIVKAAQEKALVAVETERKNKEAQLIELQDQLEVAVKGLADTRARTVEATKAEKVATEKAAAAAESLASIQGKLSKMVDAVKLMSGG